MISSFITIIRQVYYVVQPTTQNFSEEESLPNSKSRLFLKLGIPHHILPHHHRNLVGRNKNTRRVSATSSRRQKSFLAKLSTFVPLERVSVVVSPWHAHHMGYLHVARRCRWRKQRPGPVNSQMQRGKVFTCRVRVMFPRPFFRLEKAVANICT